MVVAIVVLVIAYLVAITGLFRKERDVTSAFLAVLLTAGLCVGIVKERSAAQAAHEAAQAEKDRARTEEERRLFNEKKTEEYSQEIHRLNQQIADLVTGLQAISRTATNPETKNDINILKRDIANKPLIMKVVSIHVGGDDSKSGVFKYDAPAGYRIKVFQLRERSKGGDAHYSPNLVNPTHLEVSWSVKSRTVRGPFKMVVNTITAFLDLDAEITLEQTNAGA